MLVYFLLFVQIDYLATSSVIPTASFSSDLSTVDSFPDTEVLNRNKDDIEKRKQVKSNLNYAVMYSYHKILSIRLLYNQLTAIHQF